MKKLDRRAVIAGNWKMNNDRVQTRELINELKPLVEGADCDVVICVPFTNLETALNETAGTNIKVGAQNCHFETSGAYTGEISAGMLKELGVEYVILGHSERRQYFAETNSTVNLRLKAALKENLNVIVCVGETLDERENGITSEIVSMQIKTALKDVSTEQMQNIIVAYEPVWAIGTGRTATADQAAEVCGTIRNVVSEIFDVDVSKKLTIQYGGSMNPKNCDELLSKEDVDGGLIGGASLKAKDFAAIVDSASKN